VYTIVGRRDVRGSRVAQLEGIAIHGTPIAFVGHTPQLIAFPKALRTLMLGFKRGQIGLVVFFSLLKQISPY